MDIRVEKLTTIELARRACESTMHKENVSRIPLARLYRAEHSPMRTQLFWVEMIDIPTFVSVHLVRHKIGVEHFVSTNRIDRGAEVVADRNTPVRHSMLINAQALVNLARKRLCRKASEETQEVMRRIREGIGEADPELYPYLVPDCAYRGGRCMEMKPCGRLQC